MLGDSNKTPVIHKDVLKEDMDAMQQAVSIAKEGKLLDLAANGPRDADGKVEAMAFRMKNGTEGSVETLPSGNFRFNINRGNGIIASAELDKNYGYKSDVTVKAQYLSLFDPASQQKIHDIAEQQFKGLKQASEQLQNLQNPNASVTIASTSNVVILNPVPISLADVKNTPERALKEVEAAIAQNNIALHIPDAAPVTPLPSGKNSKLKANIKVI